VVRLECLNKYAEERKPGTVSQNLSRARNSLGVKYLYRSEGQLIGRAKLIVDDLRAVYGISAGPAASSSAGVRKNVETTEGALWFSSTSAVQGDRMKLWPSLRPNGLISPVMPVP
jgi:hypothetical protein